MRLPRSQCILAITAAGCALAVPVQAKHKEKPPTPVERYIAEASQRSAAPDAPRPASGSIWSPAAPLSDLARDLRAGRVDDLVTILVAERASAVAKGTTKSARASSAKNSVAALAGPTRAKGPWANLTQLSGDSQLSGEGSTTRETVLTATLTARVTQVLPNGYLVVEAAKNLQVNSEQQMITVRGVIRPADLTPGNLVRSDRLAQLEVRVNGKGVVADAVRRPFFLYRLLLGLLPF